MAKWEDFSVSKEFKLWYTLKEMCLQYEINESKLIDYKDVTDFWEPLLEKLFRLGLQLKQTGKLKEIKMDWIRPMFYSGLDEKITMDGKVYPIEKESVYKAQELKRNFSYLVTAILDYDKVDSSNFKKLKKNLQDTSKTFFKNLIMFVTKKMYDKLKVFLKEVLRPLLDLRKANYHLFMLEKSEESDTELTFFHDKKDMKLFTETITQFFKDEEIKMKRDLDNDTFDDYLNKNRSKTYYQYSFFPKTREGFQGNKENNKIKKEILQKKFELGITVFLKYLYEKKADDFFIEIDIHKLFENLKIPKVNELKPLKFYVSNMQSILREFKEKLWEMKINGYSRIKMPITENTELLGLTKKIFDMHLLIDKIIGDKLKYDQYLFIYNCITFVVESNLKEEITIFKDKNFMENVLLKLVIYNAIRNSVNIIAQMKEKVKSNSLNEIFNLEKNFFQPYNYKLDSENNLLFNAWYYTDSIKKFSNSEIEELKVKLFQEIEEFGSRFWILEGLFCPEDKDLWFSAINILKDINYLVQDDIRDFILTNYEHFNNGNKNTEEPLLRRPMIKKESVKDTKRVSNNKIGTIKGSNIKQSTQRMSSSKGKKTQGTKRNLQNLEKTERSFESEEESMLNKGIKSNLINIDALRPPSVWNFPVDSLQKKLAHHNKEEEKKIEIRNIDPTNFYRDGRIISFLNALNLIKKKMLEFCREKKIDSWKYYFECALKAHGVAYNYNAENKNFTRTNETSINNDI